MLFRHAVVAATLLSFTACTTMQPIKNFSPATAQEHIHTGDEVHVVLGNGSVYDLEVTKVEEDSFVGEADSGKRYRIKYASIRSIESEQASAGKTAGLGAGVMAVLYAVAIVTVLALFHVVDNASGD